MQLWPSVACGSPMNAVTKSLSLRGSHASAISVLSSSNPSDSSAFVSATDSQPVGSSGFCWSAGTSNDAALGIGEGPACKAATSCAARSSEWTLAAAREEVSRENDTAPAISSAVAKAHRRTAVRRLRCRLNIGRSRRARGRACRTSGRRRHAARRARNARLRGCSAIMRHLSLELASCWLIDPY